MVLHPLRKPVFSHQPKLFHGADYTDSYPRGYLLKIKVENIQLCNCPHKYATYKGTDWIKWGSEIL